VLVSRLKCSFRAAPMLPMASVKEQIRTRKPGMGLNGGVGKGIGEGKLFFLLRHEKGMELLADAVTSVNYTSAAT